MAKSRSKEEKSAIVAASGMMYAIWLDIQSAVRERGGSDENLYQLNTPLGKSVIAKLADLIVASNGKPVEPVSHGYATHIVSVDYTRTLADMIKAGQYDWVNPDIVKQNFPVQRPNVVSKEPAMVNGPYRTPGVGNSDIRLVLVHLNKAARTDEALRHMDSLGLRPARIEELLAIGEKYPNLQLDFPIVALGSVWVRSGGYRYVPCLDRLGFGRGLDLGWDGLDGGWGGYCRFLAVSK